MAAAVGTVVVEAAVAGNEDISQLDYLNSYWQLHEPLLTHPSQIGTA